MHNFTRAIPVAVAFTLWAGASNADQFTDDVIAKFQEMGFDYIEVKEGITQLKVQAIQGADKYEVIYDRATGTILKQETERADADEIGRSGVEIDRRARDFLDDDDDDERRDEDDSRDDDDDDRDDSSGRDDDDDEDEDDSDDDDDDDDDSDDDNDDDDDDDDNDDDDDDDESDED